MSHGFLPARGTFMLDFVVVAMLGVLAVLLVSVALVRFGRRHRVHRLLQSTLAIVLLAVIIAFEIDLRLISPDWRELARPSPWYGGGWVDLALWIHLAFAIPTPLVWGTAIVHAFRHYRGGFSDPAVRSRHRQLGWTGVLFMLMTAITGWFFYWMAFIA